MLSHKDLAILTNKLQAPFIITDILDGSGELTDDVQYGLHELISDFQPDTALLSIALSACKIAGSQKYASPTAQILQTECGRIIEEYGSLWLQNARRETIASADIFDVLLHTAEDLESLAELLDISAGLLREQNTTAGRLYDILYIQAKSHALIAEAFLDAADAKIGEDSYNPPPAVTAIYTDNIIPFPGAQRA